MTGTKKRAWTKASGLVASAGKVKPLVNYEESSDRILPEELGNEESMEVPVVMIKLDCIDRSPFQNRVKPDIEATTALAVDIKAHGLNNPIIVRPKSDGRYELIAGETRVAAYRFNDESVIPAFVRSMDDGAAACKLVSDNFFHAEMSDWEIYKGLDTVKTILEMRGKILSLGDLAALTPWGKSHVHRFLSFGRLPDEVLMLLETFAEHKAPPIRARAAGDLAALAESGFPVSVIKQAVNEVLAGECEQARVAERAKLIVAGKDKSKKSNFKNSNMRAVTGPDGSLVFTLQRLPKGFSIKAIKGDDLTQLEADLVSWLENRIVST